jgi:hypothetical protein
MSYDNPNPDSGLMVIGLRKKARHGVLVQKHKRITSNKVTAQAKKERKDSCSFL